MNKIMGKQGDGERKRRQEAGDRRESTRQRLARAQAGVGRRREARVQAKGAGRRA